MVVISKGSIGLRGNALSHRLTTAQLHRRNVRAFPTADVLRILAEPHLDRYDIMAPNSTPEEGSAKTLQHVLGHPRSDWRWDRQLAVMQLRRQYPMLASAVHHWAQEQGALVSVGDFHDWMDRLDLRGATVAVVQDPPTLEEMFQGYHLGWSSPYPLMARMNDDGEAIEIQRPIVSDIDFYNEHIKGKPDVNGIGTDFKQNANRVSFRVTSELHFNINDCRVTPKIGFTIVFDRNTGRVCEFTSEYPIVYHGVFIKEHTKVVLSATAQRLASCILGRTQVFNGMVIASGLYCEFDPAFTNLNVLRLVKGFNWDLNGFQVADEAKMGHLHPPTVDIFVGSPVKLGELTIPSQHLGLIFTRLSSGSLGMAIRLEHDIVYDGCVIPAGHMLLLSHRFNVLVGIAPPYPQAASMPEGLTVTHTIEYQRRKTQPDVFYKFLDLVRSGYLQKPQ